MNRCTAKFRPHTGPKRQCRAVAVVTFEGAELCIECARKRGWMPPEPKREPPVLRVVDGAWELPDDDDDDSVIWPKTVGHA